MKNKRKPDIRFPGFSGDWEQCNLGNISTKIGSGKTPKGGNQNYKSEGIPLLRSQNIFNNKVNLNDVAYITPEIDEDMANSRVQKGDVLLNITGASIGRSAVYKLNHKANVNQHVSIIRPSSEVNPYFIQLNIASEKGQKQIELNQAGGGREGLNFQQIAKMAFYFPNLVEQGKIGDFFVQLDNIISLHQQELTTLKQTKQGFLQKMFPKEGETLPEIRFPGFTGGWEQRKFENMLDENEGIRRGPFGSALKKEYFVNESDYVVYEQQNAIYNNYETRYNITKEKFDELKKFKLEEGDFIMSGAGTIGRISRVPKGIKQGVFNQALIRFKIDTNLTDSEYFLQLIRSENMQRKLTGANPGSAITNLVPMSEVKKWDVVVPSLKEQIKIGNFLKQLDDKIALHQRELDALKETKKAFLQKMFA
ncbi:restriction endonuclease subunit S [Bacillus cereus]|nr:restriction endonuclease subunit S [Bacillus cereus]